VTSWRGRNSDVMPCGRESGGPEVLVLGVQCPGMEGGQRRPGREGGDVQGGLAAGRRAVLLGDAVPCAGVLLCGTDRDVRACWRGREGAVPWAPSRGQRPTARQGEEIAMAQRTVASWARRCRPRALAIRGSSVK
jgi:hypothetical protein